MQHTLLAPSVNETTAPIKNDKAVKAISHVLKSFFLVMFKVDPLIIIYSKTYLSDSFWRMVVEAGQQFNFAYVLPVQAGSSAAGSQCSSFNGLVPWLPSSKFGCILAYCMLDSQIPLPPHPLES
jgi:hypothetical protein